MTTTEAIDPVTAFDYGNREKRWLDGCNLCGAFRFEVLAEQDRYGFPARLMRCYECSLVQINPQMSDEEYTAFYAEGHYRRLAGQFSGSPTTHEQVRIHQRERAESICDFMSDHLKGHKVTAVDFGGSQGALVAALRYRFGAVTVLVEPAPDEANAADGEVFVGTAAEFLEQDGRPFHLAVLEQTIEHLTDPVGTLRAIRENLQSPSLLYIDFVDFERLWHNATRAGSPDKANKLDHPFAFTATTARRLLEATGFEIIQQDRSQRHLRYLARARR